MNVAGVQRRSIWVDERSNRPCIIDQSVLPHAFEVRTLASLDDAVEAIGTMRVRGAPLIGATAAHGFALALERDPSDAALREAFERLVATRPTAINLRWALERVQACVRDVDPRRRAERARAEAVAICEEDVAVCSAIGDHGHAMLAALAASKRSPKSNSSQPLQILTHCNAGWLATVDWGTALAPVYKAHAAGLELHVWVDETRPRNQGSALTAYELREQGVPHTIVVDNAGGHLMQRGDVDVVLVGSDRTTRRGDVCNKIGTYLKALAARDCGIPFYVALPVSTIDWAIRDGLTSIPIEERSAAEVRIVRGRDAAGRLIDVELFDAGTAAANPAFDVTPAHLVTGLVTEHGVHEASEAALARLALWAGSGQAAAGRPTQTP